MRTKIELHEGTGSRRRFAVASRRQFAVAGRRRRAFGRQRWLTTLIATAAAMMLVVAPASAGTGGTSAPGEGPTGKAKLKNGRAIAPVDAPNRVVDVIEAANEIAKGHGYCLGGGHRRWNSKCYDCSGAVSYALHGGRFVDSPMPSGAYKRWGKRGKGDWITTYAHNGHMYAVIAGLRFDTSMTAGAGPGWSSEMRSSNGFRKRHPKGY